MIMLKDKKGMEMGMNVIVMAVIALAVLIVMLIVFSGKFGMFSSEISKCRETGNGVCVDGDTECKDIYNGRVVDFKCGDDEAGDICCVSACTMAGGTCESGGCGSGKESLFISCANNYQCCK